MTTLDLHDGDRDQRRRASDNVLGNSLIWELAKLILPLVIAWFIAWSTATNTVATEVAVVKEREQAHFEEIQRTLNRIDAWITRQEKGR